MQPRKSAQRLPACFLVRWRKAWFQGRRPRDARSQTQGRNALERARHSQRDRDCKSTVHSLFQLFGLQPHRTRSFILSTDPFFVEKLRDVVVSTFTSRYPSWLFRFHRRPRQKNWPLHPHPQCKFTPFRGEPSALDSFPMGVGERTGAHHEQRTRAALDDFRNEQGSAAR